MSDSQFRLKSSRSESSSGLNSVSLLNGSDSKVEGQHNYLSKQMKAKLDSKFEADKLDSMKRLIAMMTLGRDVSAFFPDVVKNIITENTEVKKLVYMYLIHYAETNADLALLSINTFQKDLSSPNPRVRANAMRAMSSIHLPVVIPLVMIAIQQAAGDSSPYVRKAAACALPKVYAVDPNQKNDLIDLLEKLLSNEDTEVLGCAIFAFKEICPERLDLLHPHYHKFCHLLADFDEYGQILCLDILLRYGRTQFASPFKKKLNDPNKKSHYISFEQNKKETKVEDLDSFYGSSTKLNENNDKDDESINGFDKNSDNNLNNQDNNHSNKDDDDEEEITEDHRTLLKSASQLIHSRNSGVIAGVASIFLHLAPYEEARTVAKALVRASRHHPSVQYSILSIISTMAHERPIIFQPYVKDFYVFSADNTLVKLLKLDVLVQLANPENVSDILREFQYYIYDQSVEFVTATIQSIGRIASTMSNIGEKCMKGLMGLVNSNEEDIVAESVIVIRQMLQQDTSAHRGVIKQLIRLLDTVHNPKARSAIIWVIGEYRESVPKLAPDVLRRLAKTFRTEHQSVKLQVLNMAVKLFLSNPKQTALLFKYIMDLCKYDQSYDLRDRARFFRALFFKKKGAKIELSGEFKDIIKSGIIENKPSVVIDHPFSGRERYILHSMSHIVNMEVRGYHALPDFPEKSLDPSVRARFNLSKRQSISALISDSNPTSARSGNTSSRSLNKYTTGTVNIDDFYASDKDSSDSSSSDSDSDSDDDTSSSSGSSGESLLESESNSDSSGSESNSDSSESESNNLDTTTDVVAALADSDEELDLENLDGFTKTPSKSTEATVKSDSNVTNDIIGFDQLNDNDNKISNNESTNNNNNNTNNDNFNLLENNISATDNNNHRNNNKVEMDDLLSNENKNENNNDINDSIERPKFGSSGVLLDHTHSAGLSVNYKFSRTPSMYGKDLTAIHLSLENHRDENLNDICITKSSLENSNIVRSFDPILLLGPKNISDVKLHVDLRKNLELKVEFQTDRGLFPVKLDVPLGERIKPDIISHEEFDEIQAKLQGMEQSSVTLNIANKKIEKVPSCVCQAFNVHPLSSQSNDDSIIYRFAARLVENSDQNLLVQLSVPTNTGEKQTKVQLIVNCQDFLFVDHVVKNLKSVILYSD